MPQLNYPSGREALTTLGVQRMAWFCRANGIPAPLVTVIPKSEWNVNACAFYRADGPSIRKWLSRTPYRPGINICVDLCQYPAPHANSRNWSWPSATVDRTPYGVIAHELGHHCDWLAGEKKWSYGSEYCEQVMGESKEAPLTGYADNPAEWFAEMFRLFVTNPSLLRAVRHKTYTQLLLRWKPVTSAGWVATLGANCPSRVVNAQRNKVTR